MRSPPIDEEVTETTCDELTTTPMLSPCATVEEEGENTVSEIKPREKKDVGEVLKICFYFSLFSFD